MGSYLAVSSTSLHFTWICGIDDKGTDLQSYSFHADDLWTGLYPRDDVLNHHLQGRTPLRHGDVVAGILPGSALIGESLPARFTHDHVLDAELTFEDQFGHQYSLQP